jgi:hypothetical protein
MNHKLLNEQAMKKLFLILSLFFSIASSASDTTRVETGTSFFQFWRYRTAPPAIPNYTDISSQYRWLAVAATRTMHAPSGSAAAIGTNGWQAAGWLYVDTVGTTDTGMYYGGTGGSKHRLARASELPGAGYTNLTQFVDQTNWRLFYSNGSGDVTELALGTSGQLLQSAGTTSAPTWLTPTYISTRDRFGFSGEDETATADRTFDLNGNAMNILGTGLYINYDNNYTFHQIGSGVGSRFFELATGGFAVTVNRNPSGSSGFDVYPDSIKLRPFQGNLNIQTLRTASDTTLSKPMTYDPVTGRWQYLNYWPGGGGGGYTNLTQFVAQGNWKTFYSNGSGDVTELALGDAGKVLTSNGASAAPTWETPATGSGTVNTGAANKLAYYPGAGTTVDDLANLEYTSSQLILTGNTDVNAVGPLVVKSTGTGITGTALTLDGTSETGGAKWSFISTGATATPGAGHFAFYTPSRGYAALFKNDGELWIGQANPSPGNDLGTYMLQVTGAGIFTEGVVINEGGADSDTRIESDTHTDAFLIDATDGSTTLGAYGGGSITGTLTYGLGVNSSGKIIEVALAEGTYTPALTNQSNVNASTASVTNYVRIGDRIHVFGKVSIDATATGAFELRMDLPITSASTQDYEIAGTAVCGSTGVPIAISANVASGLASFQGIATTTTADTYFFTFSYKYNAP